MLGAGRPQEGYDFFNAIPPQVPDLRKFPTYRPCTFPMAAKRYPNKTLMNHVFLFTRCLDAQYAISLLLSVSIPFLLLQGMAIHYL